MNKFTSASAIQKLASKFGTIALAITLLISISLQPASAEIDHRKLKGVHDLIIPEYQHLSPVYGFTVLKKGILENLFRYGVQEDQTVRLTHLLFHTVDETNFNATALPTAVASHFNTQTVGDLLKALVENESEDSASIREKNVLEAIQNSLGMSSEETFKARFSDKKQRQKLRKNSKEFAETLLAAQAETKGSEAKYLPHFAEHILLGFFWMKAKNEKSEFLDLLGRIPQILSPSAEILINNSNRLAGWLENNYSIDLYTSETKILHRLENFSAKSHSMLEDPGTAAFMAYSYKVWDGFLPPIFGYERTRYTSSNGLTESFADCGESSIRNFLNIVLKNPQTQTFDLSFIRAKAKEKGLELSSAFTQFYEKHSSLTNLGAADLHREWVNVVSELGRGVCYKYPEDSVDRFCNLTAGMNSALNVFGTLVFSNDPQFEKLNKVEKMDQVTEFFSRPNFELTWKVHGDFEKDYIRSPTFNTGITIDFSVNGNPSFSWEFRSGHFVISSLAESTYDWRRHFSIPFLEQWDKLRSWENPKDALPLVLSSWFHFEDKNYELLECLEGMNATSAEKQLLIWSNPLRTDASRMFAIHSIIHKKWDNLYPILDQLNHGITIDRYFLKTLEIALESQQPELKAFASRALDSLDGDTDMISGIVKTCLERKLNLTLNLIAERFGAHWLDLADRD